MTKQKLSYRIFIIAVLILFAFLAVAPFVYLIIASLVEDMSQVFKNGLALNITPDMLGTANYRMLATEQHGIFFRWFGNSVIVTLFFTTLSLVTSSMVGYGVSVYRFKGRKIYIVMIMSTMMIPVEILMLPLYREMLSFRLLNSYVGVVIPFAVSSFAIYFFMQYATNLPRELVDAGRVDGCGEFRIFVQIMGPLMLPAFGSMGILQAMTAWNDFLWPMIVMSTTDSFTLTVGLQTYLSPYGNNYNMLFAGAVISVIPLMVIFLCNQNAFISGIMAGSVKG